MTHGYVHNLEKLLSILTERILDADLILAGFFQDRTFAMSNAWDRTGGSTHGAGNSHAVVNSQKAGSAPHMHSGESLHRLQLQKPSRPKWSCFQAILSMSRMSGCFGIHATL